MEQSLKTIFENANQHFIAGDYKKAEPILHQLVLKNYKNAKLFYMLGAIQYQKNDIKKALRSFKRSLDIDPSFTDAGIGLSIIYNDLGHYKEGRKVFIDTQRHLKPSTESNLLSERKRKYLSKHLELANMYNEDKQYSEALNQLVKAKSYSSTNSKIQILISECLLNMKQYQKAINELKLVLVNDENNVSALMRLGQVYNLVGKKSEAESSFQKVLLIDPHHLGANQRINLHRSQTNYTQKEL